jgi:hypothetical protein
MLGMVASVIHLETAGPKQSQAVVIAPLVNPPEREKPL